MKDFLSTKVDTKPTVMIFGSRSIKEIPQIAIASLNKIIELGFNVIIGDATGVDAAVQRYLRLRDYKNVTVYYATFAGVGSPRNSSGFKTVGVPGNYSQRDAEMRLIAEYKYGLAIWDGVSRGTKASIEVMKCCKVITVK
ncbi:hypothetical protein H6G32_11450 [Cylindrospermum sp. FACHB-282]|nr:hypothetical protein [Cylindrospermum sp. FACHB-282]